MFRKKYKHMIGQIHPKEELISNILKSIDSSHKKGIIKRPYFRKPAVAVIVIAIACLCIFITIPTLAAKIDPIYHIIYMVSPGIAQRFIPVQKWDEDNGIRMEVMSSYIRDNMADIYISMKDLEGNRIDDTIDLFDSYSINRPFNCSATCKRVDYNEEDKTAIFLISITQLGNKDIKGSKITFSVKNFISNKQNYDDIEIPISLSKVKDTKDTQEIFPSGSSGKNYMKYISGNRVTALKPSEPIKEFPIDGVLLTGIGYVDESLHIQTAVYDNLKKDNHGYFYLKDRNGNVQNSNYTFSFFEQIQQSERVDYHEHVFNIPKEEIGLYALYGNFVITGKYTEGDWRVTFPLTKDNK